MCQVAGTERSTAMKKASTDQETDVKTSRFKNTRTSLSTLYFLWDPERLWLMLSSISSASFMNLKAVNVHLPPTHAKLK